MHFEVSPLYHPYRFDGRVEAAHVAASVFPQEPRLITNVYIDGFNLYYRALKDTRSDGWTCTGSRRRSSPRTRFTRSTTSLPDLRFGPATPDKPNASLCTCAPSPHCRILEVHYGGIPVRGGSAGHSPNPSRGLPTHVLVRDSEEKGSDVNLATRLLVDGFNGEYEQAVVVSNDADFAGAMRYVRDGLGLRVTLVNPDARTSSPRDLAAAATYVKRLWRSHLRRSRFPDTVRDEVGAITKPPGW